MFHSGQWGTVCDDGWTLTEAQVVCRSLNCGPALQFKRRTFYGPGSGSIWLDGVRCRGDERSLTECEHGEFGKHFCFNDEVIGVICSESVQLVSGRSLCSGSLQIRERSMSESWSWVCDGALDSRGAEVLCRELSCGAPLLQGALSPLDQMFHCEGHESSLMNCPRNQTRTNPETCSRLNLTCTEQLRLVGGASRCEGIMELEFRGEWRRLMYDFWNSRNLEPVVAVCQNLKCGSVVFTDIRRGLTRSDVWFIRSECMNRTNAALRDCIIHDFSALPHGLQMVCSGKVELVNFFFSKAAQNLCAQCQSSLKAAVPPSGTKVFKKPLPPVLPHVISLTLYASNSFILLQSVGSLMKLLSELQEEPDSVNLELSLTATDLALQENNVNV